MTATVKGLKEVQRALKSYATDVQRVQTRALNRTITKGRTLTSKEIRSEVNLKAGYVKERVDIRKADFSKQIASIVARKRGILLSRFPNRIIKKKGVSVRVKRGSAKFIKGAFKANVKAGGRTVEVVALRVPGRYKNGNAKFKALYGPSPSQVFANVRDKIGPQLERELLLQLQKELDSAAKRARR